MATVNNHIAPGARISGVAIQGANFTVVHGRRTTAVPAPAPAAVPVNLADGVVRAPDGTVIAPERNAHVIAGLLLELAALVPAKAELATAYAHAMTGPQN
ncbi:hypothetical protein [Streptomyces sp. XH2]|uniref:hypothetical protein n=1 Tax=Streptomyces sp. XH2 TaxID=3412483 RepID=UPI003C7DEC83